MILLSEKKLRLIDMLLSRKKNFDTKLTGVCLLECESTTDRSFSHTCLNLLIGVYQCGKLKLIRDKKA